MTKAQYIQDIELLSKLPVFYQPWYLNIFGESWDVAFSKTENGVSVFPYFIEKKGPVKLSRPPYLTPYYGPFTTSGNKNDISKLVNAVLKKVDVLTLVMHYEIPSQLLVQEKFEVKEKITHILRLSDFSEDELLKNMDNMRRRNINKAAKELTLHETTFDINQYYDWIQHTYAKRNIKVPYSFGFLNKYVNAAITNKAAIYNTYYNAERVAVAMSLCLYDNYSAYYILGANNPDVKHSAASTALLWQAIKTAKNKGVKIFDFEGSSIPEIAQFFQKFGGEKIIFNALEKNNSLIWKLKQKIFK